MGRGNEVEGGRAADEDGVLGEELLDSGIHGAAARAVGVEGELILDLRRLSEDGEGDGTRGMEFNALARKFGKSVFLAEHFDVLCGAFAVAGKNGVADEVERLCFLVVLRVLQAVVAEDIDGVALHLVEDSGAHTRADHNNAVFFRESVEDRAVAVVKRSAMLSESAVEVKGDHFQLRDIDLIIRSKYHDLSSF